MSDVKYLSSYGLGQHLKQSLNDIPVYSNQQDWEIDQAFPSICILPGKHTFQPWIAREINTNDANALLKHVGDWEGSTEIRIYSKKSPERDRIEQVITEAFMAREMSPGLIMVDVPGINYGGIQWTDTSYAAFILEDEDWREEMVFTDSRYSYLSLSSSYQMYSSANIPNLHLKLELYINNRFDKEIAIQ